MEAQDYPVEHFELMRELASRMRTIPIQVLKHEYNYEVFGSWWFQFMRSGQRFRILFDGKESSMILESKSKNGFNTEWQEISIKEVSDRDAESLIDLVLALLDNT